jgi:hypothetical protein
MTLAHIGAVPVEELLALAPAAGALCLALRARLSLPARAARSGSRRDP